MTKSARVKLLAQMAIARRDLGLDEDTYRDALERETGKRSAKELGDPDLTRVIEMFKARGWTGGSNTSGFKPSSKGFVRKIYAIWGQLKRDGIWREDDSGSLRRFVQKITGVASPEWLTYREASLVIEALKKMQERGAK